MFISEKKHITDFRKKTVSLHVRVYCPNFKIKDLPIHSYLFKYCLAIIKDVTYDVFYNLIMEGFFLKKPSMYDLSLRSVMPDILMCVNDVVSHFFSVNNDVTCPLNPLECEN